MIIRRQLGPNGVFQRRVIQLSADAPLFRTFLPTEIGAPYRRRLVGYFVPSDHIGEGPGGGDSSGVPFRQTAVTVIVG